LSPFDKLLATLDDDRQVVIQAHDFPDHDAVGASYALATLLGARGIQAVLSYGGSIQSDSLAEEIELLEIPIQSVAEAGIDANAQIVVVDGFVGNSNIAGRVAPLCTSMFGTHRLRLTDQLPRPSSWV